MITCYQVEDMDMTGKHHLLHRRKNQFDILRNIFLGYCLCSAKIFIFI